MNEIISLCVSTNSEIKKILVGYVIYNNELKGPIMNYHILT